MKTHVIASAVLLAACVAPRAERNESASEEPPAESGAPATSAREEPSALEVVEIARRRAELEAATQDKMAPANDKTHAKQVSGSWVQTLTRAIDDERNRFSQWCEKAQGWNAEKRRSGAPGLTPEDLLKVTGKPTQESTPESRDGSVEARAWSWEVTGPISRTVSFAILFMRPAGTDDPWIFGGCRWCASGSPATTQGCVTLPEGK